MKGDDMQMIENIEELLHKWTEAKDNLYKMASKSWSENNDYEHSVYRGKGDAISYCINSLMNEINLTELIGEVEKLEKFCSNHIKPINFMEACEIHNKTFKITCEIDDTEHEFNNCSIGEFINTVKTFPPYTMQKMITKADFYLVED